MPKSKAKTTHHRYHRLTTPTTTSRALTWILLLSLPVIAFFLGMRYQESKDTIKMFDLQDSMVQQQYMMSTPSAK